MRMIALIFFWACLFLIFYTYIGYGLVLYIWISIRHWKNKKEEDEPTKEATLPKVTVVIAAYNEEDFIGAKIENTLTVDYPEDRLEILVVTDGSNDQTVKIVQSYLHHKSVQLHHQPQRAGKIAAVERIIPVIENPYIIFSDANTLVNRAAVRNLIKHYKYPYIGAVAGEKRIQVAENDDASSAGEGFYWRYESALKKWDAELYSVVGAAGELFSIRRDIYETVPKDTIIEDFYTSMRVTQRGYRVAYAPDAYAIEKASLTVNEELKRKIRIAAGGLQAIYRLRPLLNIFRYGTLSFQYISHRVLRWTLAPLALVVLLVTNIYLALEGSTFYTFILWVQFCFYGLAALGYLLERRKIKVKAFFIPYYFCVMNYAVFRGFFRIMNNQQSVLWDRAKRR